MSLPLVPELSVLDCRRSLVFYRMLGFQVRYDRPEEGFAYLEREGAELMIDEIGGSRDFRPLAEADRPFGRGMNLQIRVSDLSPLLAALDAAGNTLHLPPEERWYRRENSLVGQRQFIVADPDGYLLRFCQSIGERRATDGNT